MLGRWRRIRKRSFRCVHSGADLAFDERFGEQGWSAARRWASSTMSTTPNAYPDTTTHHNRVHSDSNQVRVDLVESLESLSQNRVRLGKRAHLFTQARHTDGELHRQEQQRE